MFDSGIYLYLRTVNAVDIIIHYQKMAKEKFYVVWEGVTPGVYASWTDCQLQIKGYEGAKYKSFDTREEAERALASSPYAYIGKNAKKKRKLPEPVPIHCLLPSLTIVWQSMLRAVAIPARWSIGGTRGKPPGNFSFRPDERYKQYWRVSGHRARTGIAETERI